MSTLVVSAKRETLAWLEAHLEAKSLPLELAEDAAAALDRLAHGASGLVIVDLRPGAEAGLMSLDRIRAARPEIALLALTESLKGGLAVEAFRAGASDVASTEDGALGLATAVARALGQQQRGPRARTTAVFAASGGLGATTLCVSLCERMSARHAGDVVLVDLDLYLGSARAWLPEIETAGPHELMDEIERLDAELIPSLLPTTSAGFRLASGGSDVQDAESVSNGRLRELVRALAEHTDHLVLDLPHDFSTATLAGLDACDELLLVVGQDPPSLRRAQAALAFCAELGIGNERVGAVVQRFDRRGDLLAEDVARILGVDVVASIPREDAAFIEAARDRRPLAEVAPSARATRAIDALAARLLGEEEPVPRGPLARLRKLTRGPS